MNNRHTTLNEREQCLHFLKGVLESSMDGVVITDISNSIIAVNRSFASLFGSSVSEMLKTNLIIWLKMLDPNAPDTWAFLLDKITLEKRINAFQYESEERFFKVNGSLVEYIHESRVVVWVFRDITEQKLAEEAFQRREAEYGNLVEQANDGIVIIQDSIIIYANHQMAGMAGYRVDEIVNTLFTDYIHPDVLSKTLEVYTQRIKGDEIRSINESALKHKDGRKIYVEFNSRVGTYNGQPVNITFTRDISHRKRVEKALLENERKYRILFDSSVTGTYVTSLRGEILAVNEAGSTLLGYDTPEALLGKSILEFYRNPETRNVVYPKIAGGKTTQLELRLRKKGGTEVNVLICASTIIFDEKKAILTSAVDINERKRMEKALQESEKRYERIIDAAADAIVILNEEGKILDVNPAGCRIVNSTHDVLIGTEIMDFIHPDHHDSFNEYVQQIESTGSVHLESMGMREDRSSFPVEIHGTWFTHGGNRAYVAIIRDITERKQAEEHKAQLEAQLQQIRRMESLSVLAGGIAHDFNNALAGITGNTDLLQMKFSGNETINRYVERINESTQRMAGLTNQLLAYARGGKYQPQILSLSDFVKDSLPLIQHKINPVIHLDTDLSEDTYSIEGDITQMKMVISAVMSNAAEAIEGSGRIKITVGNEELNEGFSAEQTGLKRKKYACLTIEDNGTGMDQESVNKLFEPFFTTKSLGRGLGMAAAYGIVRNHDGWISVDSQVGKGTVVRIYLPAVASQIKEVERSVEKFQMESYTSTATILIIEDEEAVIEAYQEILENMSYHVLPARTGMEAIDFARTFDGDIDLALLDIGLPDLNGDKVYPLLKEARPNLKVIVCTGFSIDGPAQDVLDAGAEDFIKKPFSLNKLSAKIKEILENKEKE